MDTLKHANAHSETATLRYEIAIASTLMTRRIRARFGERVKSTSQTEARWMALYHLAREPGGLIQTELAERMAIRGPTLVRLLDALEVQGLVSRRSTPEDRRAKRVFIELAGTRIVAGLDEVAAELRADAFAGISDADLRTTLNVLQRASEAMAMHDPDATTQANAGPLEFVAAD
jgi:MarR family transcriptional regulator for hemolysin